jgi:hypothetical protein
MLQRGIALCLEHQVLAVLLNLCISAVEVSFSLRHYADAESYADSGAKVAAGVLNPFVYADMLERRGDAQIEQQKVEEALASYQRCVEVSRMYEIFPRWTSALESQAGAFERVKKPSDARATREELARVLELEKAAGSGQARGPELIPEG